MGRDYWRLGWFELITPISIICFAVWTVSVHVLSLTHDSFAALLRLLPLVAGAAAVGVFVWVGRHRKVSSATTAAIELASNARGLVWWPVIASVVWVFVYALTRNFVIFWWGAVILLLFANLRLIRRGDIFLSEPAGLTRRGLAILIGLCALAVVVTLAANHPDIDDAFYMSIPASLLHSPNQPILLHDTLYRLSWLPIESTVYREHTYEVLIGVLAWLSGLPPVKVAYLGLPPVMAVLTVIAWAQLLRLLAATHWLRVTALLVLCMLLLGEVHHAYGNFGFVRLFQGKALLLCWGVPAVLYFALAYMRQGRLVDWLMLLASEIAAIGLTSTGLFVVPVAAALALTSVWVPNATVTRRALVGILASGYGMLVATLLALDSRRFIASLVNVEPSTLQNVVEDTFGHWSVLPLLVALLAAWALCESGFAARVLAGTALLFLLTCFDPYIYQLWMHHVMGASTFWRLSWAVPLPFMLAILVHGLLAHGMSVRKWGARYLVPVMATCAVAWFAMECGTLRTANHVTLGVPGIKAPPADYALAQKLVREVPQSGTLLAPVSIASWCSTFVFHPMLLSVRPMYLLSLRPWLGKDDVARRYALQLYVSGWKREPQAPAMLGDAISRYHLDVVVVADTAPWKVEIGSILGKAGFSGLVDGHYVLWRRQPGYRSAP